MSLLERPRCLLLALAALAGCGTEPEPLPPNLLFVSIDTLRADVLGSHGATWGATPYLDRLADEGIRFASAWSHSPKTAPSHMSMFTGLPPRTHGVGNQRSSGSPTLSGSVTTLAEALQQAGYRTGAVTAGGNVKGHLGFARGFEVYQERPSRPEAKLAAMESWIRGAAAPGQGEAPRPWFAFFHTYAVHDPYLPPPDLAARYADPAYAGAIVGDSERLSQAIRAGEDLAPWAEGYAKKTENFWARVDADDPADLEHLRHLYLAGVADFDRLLGEFMDGLAAEGLLENTLVVVTSDHGEEFGEHGDTRHNGVWQEHLHVPLLLLVPGVEGGRVVDASVRHMDLMPSLLELLGLPAAGLVEHGMLGESWAAWLLDPAAEPRDRPVLGEHRSRLERPLDIWSLRHDGLLLIQSEPEGEPRLVDLSEADAERLVEGLPAGLRPSEDPRHAELLDLQRRELGRFQAGGEGLGAGPGVELDPETRAELEALGYL